MEKTGGLSTELKQKIADSKVVIIGNEVAELIAQAIGRLGFTDVVSTSESLDLPHCDYAICVCSDKEQCRNVITHYGNIGVPVICAFNFGIGACVTIVMPDDSRIHFIEDKADKDPVKAMLEYTEGYSAFWHIPRNSWVEDAMKYVCTPEVRSSVGEFTMTAITAHLLIALVADNEVKTYPKFYLSTIANDIN